MSPFMWYIVVLFMKKFRFQKTGLPPVPHFLMLTKKFVCICWPFSVWNDPNQRSFAFLRGLVWYLSLSPPYSSRCHPCEGTKMLTLGYWDVALYKQGNRNVVLLSVTVLFKKRMEYENDIFYQNVVFILYLLLCHL